MATQTVHGRAELGRAARKWASRSSHGEWTPAAGRPDPVTLLAEQNERDYEEFLAAIDDCRLEVAERS